MIETGFVTISNNILPVLGIILAIALSYAVFSYALLRLKKKLLKRAKTKKQISNVELFSKTIKYGFLFFLTVSAVLYFSGSATGFGLTVGLVSAALGFALQKPITGIAAWVMIVSRRPFEIGDRIIIGPFKGDVKDITLTHIYLNEIGGTVSSEENSGRILMVPNSVLFEQHIINYTQQDDYILDEISVSLTYEGNLDAGIKIIENAGKKFSKPFLANIPKEPFVRIFFDASSVNVKLRFYVPAKQRSEISSNITKEIYDEIIAQSDVEFAYPHTETIVNYKEDFIKRHKKTGKIGKLKDYF